MWFGGGYTKMSKIVKMNPMKTPLCHSFYEYQVRNMNPMSGTVGYRVLYDNLRMILGFEWSGGLCLCEALLGWVLVTAAAAGRGCGRC